jgi:hypothetical protein
MRRASRRAGDRFDAAECPVLNLRTVAQDRGDVAQGHDWSSFFTARMRSRAIHPASEAASGVEYDSPVLSAQLGSSIRVIT